jgi:hypothetical protein
MLAEAFAEHTEKIRAGAMACIASLILNYAENVRRIRRAGILRTYETRGTAQHNRGIKRKKSIAQSEKIVRRTTEKHSVRSFS